MIEDRECRSCGGEMPDATDLLCAQCNYDEVCEPMTTITVTPAEVEAARYLQRHGGQRESVRKIAEVGE